MLNSLAAAPRAADAATSLDSTTRLTRGRFGFCVVQSVFMSVVRRQSPSHGLTTPVDRFRDATR